jgi:DNA-binding transcriptional regulator YiaG
VLRVKALDAALSLARLRRGLPSPSARRRIRERAGIAQRHVAEALGVDRAAVSRWETGDRDPSGATLAEYVRLLEKLAHEATQR